MLPCAGEKGTGLGMQACHLGLFPHSPVSPLLPSSSFASLPQNREVPILSEHPPKLHSLCLRNTKRDGNRCMDFTDRESCFKGSSELSCHPTLDRLERFCVQDFLPPQHFLPPLKYFSALLWQTQRMACHPLVLIFGGARLLP